MAPRPNNRRRTLRRSLTIARFTQAATSRTPICHPPPSPKSKISASPPSRVKKPGFQIGSVKSLKLPPMHPATMERADGKLTLVHGVLGKTIGKGASGRVRKARHATTGQDAAIKIVSKKSAEVLRSQSLAFIDAKAEQGKRTIPFGIEREVVIMKMIEHPNIIKLFDIWENRGEL